VVSFVLFHLTNHLLGLVRPDVHAAVMKVGRRVYRSPVVEPVLIGLLLFQVVSGARLAWRWSSLPADAYRVFQIGSGAYLAAFILAHLNSALISARTVHKIDTGWPGPRVRRPASSTMRGTFASFRTMHSASSSSWRISLRDFAESSSRTAWPPQSPIGCGRLHSS
jgi:hypothetical protein